jgi:type IV secretory pathway VirB2 component (pilin)
MTNFSLNLPKVFFKLILNSLGKKLEFFSFFLVILLSLGFVNFSFPVMAQNNQVDIVPNQNLICGGQQCPTINLENVRFQNRDDLANFIVRVAQFLTYIGVALAVLFLVIGGIQFMIGKPDAGWKAINTTIIGVFIIIISYTAVAVITQFLTGNILDQSLTTQTSQTTGQSLTR